MRRAIHAFLNFLGVLAWLVAYAAMQIVFWLSLLGDKVLPNARIGNCWTFVCPRLMKFGGYMVVRSVRRGRFFGVGLIPHVSWLQSITADSVLLQTEPIDRYEGRWKFWRFFYFNFRIKSSETGRPGPWRNLKD